MILSTFLYVLNIIIILALAFYLVFLIGDRKYSFIKSVISCFFWNFTGIMWYYFNPIYLIRMMYVGVLLMINITLIGQLMNSALFNRTIWLLTLSPLVWLFVLCDTYFREKEIKNKKMLE